MLAKLLLNVQQSANNDNSDKENESVNMNDQSANLTKEVAQEGTSEGIK